MKLQMLLWNPHCELLLVSKPHLPKVFRVRILDRWSEFDNVIGLRKTERRRRKTKEDQDQACMFPVSRLIFYVTSGLSSGSLSPKWCFMQNHKSLSFKRRFICRHYHNIIPTLPFLIRTLSFAPPILFQSCGLITPLTVVAHICIHISIPKFNLLSLDNVTFVRFQGWSFSIRQPTDVFFPS